MYCIAAYIGGNYIWQLDPKIAISNIDWFKCSGLVQDHHTYICEHESLADFNNVMAAVKADCQTAKFFVYTVVQIHTGMQYSNYTWPIYQKYRCIIPLVALLHLIIQLVRRSYPMIIAITVIRNPHCNIVSADILSCRYPNTLPWWLIDELHL